MCRRQKRTTNALLRKVHSLCGLKLSTCLCLINTRKVKREGLARLLIQPSNQDVFGNEEFAEVKYKVLKWWYAVAWIPFLYLYAELTGSVQAMWSANGGRNHLHGHSLTPNRICRFRAGSCDCHPSWTRRSCYLYRLRNRAVQVQIPPCL